LRSNQKSNLLNAASADIGTQKNRKDYRGNNRRKGIFSAAFLLIWIMDLRRNLAISRRWGKRRKPGLMRPYEGNPFVSSLSREVFAGLDGRFARPRVARPDNLSGV
jgi:hypothetical protein